MGHDHSKQLVDAHTGSDRRQSSGLVEHDVACPRGQSHDESAGVLRSVAVAAAQAARQRAPRAGLFEGRGEVAGIDGHLIGNGRVGATPAPEMGTKGDRHAGGFYSPALRERW